LHRFGNQTTKNILIFIVFISVIVLMGWGNYHFVENNPGGHEFLINWVGTQSMVKESISPYSNTITNRIERFAESNQSNIGGEASYQFNQPLYSIFLYLPFSLISDFNLARAIWMVVLQLAYITIIFLSAQLLNWRPSFFLSVLLIVFSFFWIHGLFPLINGDSVILIALCIVFCVYAIKNRQDELAGISLALTTIKPYVVVFVIAAILIWAITNKRWKIVFWFFGTQVLVFLLSMFFMPGWFIQYLQNVVNPQFIPKMSSLSQALAVLLPGIGEKLGTIISIIAILLIIIELFLGRFSKEIAFFWMISVILVLGLLVNIPTKPDHFVITLPALMIALKNIEERWKGGSWVNLLILIVVFFLPWLVFFETTIFATGANESPLMFLMIPGLFLILLYWVRWWIKNPIKHTLDF